jgi:hypothetical protein
MSDDESRTADNRLHNIAGRWKTSGDEIGERKIRVVGTDDYKCA